MLRPDAIFCFSSSFQSGANRSITSCRDYDDGRLLESIFEYLESNLGCYGWFSSSPFGLELRLRLHYSVMSPYFSLISCLFSPYLIRIVPGGYQSVFHWVSKFCWRGYGSSRAHRRSCWSIGWTLWVKRCRPHRTHSHLIWGVCHIGETLWCLPKRAVDRAIRAIFCTWSICSVRLSPAQFFELQISIDYALSLRKTSTDSIIISRDLSTLVIFYMLWSLLWLN